jgi:hypothetical protein
MPGTIGFEFNCAGFDTYDGDNDNINMVVKFDWEKPDGKDYDREYGAPEAVKKFFMMLNSFNENEGYLYPEIKAQPFAKNGVYIKNVNIYHISVNS